MTWVMCSVCDLLQTIFLPHLAYKCLLTSVSRNICGSVGLIPLQGQSKKNIVHFATLRSSTLILLPLNLFQYFISVWNVTVYLWLSLIKNTCNYRGSLPFTSGPCLYSCSIISEWQHNSSIWHHLINLRNKQSNKQWMKVGGGAPLCGQTQP